ncbi:hypothetical protein FRB97_004936 [Tulasnella sp. 331]|nr:hypothetical protein FRB97_004936 [Tulasnella sp. 331]KAG8886849.1 hypothetical protein FRB98_000931 [Tulasnella sp. 332]
MDEEEWTPLMGTSTEELSSTLVFPLIHRIKRDADKNIDTALTWEQLNAPEINFSIVKPLVAMYARIHNKAVIYAFLVVRSHYMTSADEDLAFANMFMARAAFCELMAMKLLREFPNFDLVVVCTTPWNALQGATDEMLQSIRKEVGDDDMKADPMSALEVAISTEAKHFLATPLAQEVINEIWQGRVLLSTSSSHSLLSDDYKRRPIATHHDPKGAPLLDHYRLRVPKYRSIIEMLNFGILLFLFVLCITYKDFSRVGWTEIVFSVFTLGFLLDEFAAMQEHGWRVYVANMWNGFDLSFIFLFLLYVGLRLKGLLTHNDYLNDLAFDILACGACILIPRVAFFFISNNVVIVALRVMIVQFALFIGVAATCFSGLLFTLWKLSGDEWTLKKIAWLMVQIWFGNTYLSFTVAESFHPLFGPPLMIIFAALSNTLLITILISILSATYAKINEHATQEYLYQSAINTLEGVKTDALFSYQPPFNLAAYAILAPASCVLSPRMLHSLNVLLIRLTSFHILVAITLYERYLAPGSRFIESSKDKARTVFDSLPRHIRQASLLEAIMGSSSHDLLDALFDVDVGDDQFNDFDSEDIPRTPQIKASKPFDDSQNDAAPVTPRRGRYTSGATVPASPGLSRRSQSRNGAFLAPPAVSSPLAQLFTAGLRQSWGPMSAVAQDDLTTSMRRMEGRLGGMPEADKMKSDLKDTRERLERIETLLQSLVRGSGS